MTIKTINYRQPLGCQIPKTGDVYEDCIITGVLANEVYNHSESTQEVFLKVIPVTEVLTPREKEIFLLREMIATDIANQFNLTVERVEQIQNKIKAKIKNIKGE